MSILRPERANPSPEPTALSQRITFSAVTSADFDQLVALRIAAMRNSLERVGRFDPERARERFRKSFFPDHTKFILLDTQRVGFYTFRATEEAFHLDHLYIHPNHQAGGIGSHVMRHLLSWSDAREMPVQLGALRDSSANRFYQRHGFVRVREDEWDIYYVRTPSLNETGNV
ncbi:MAG TPA: GNAT family N-acetyltransferase [Verrucomicrobiae bacterium]|jgi:GNAT superfamily N-acetyltransferase